MAGEFADEVRVFDLLVEVADEGASCHVAGADLVEVALLGLTGSLIQDCDNSVDSGGVEGFLDEVIVFACTDEREQVARISLLVALHNLDGGRGEVNLDGARALLLGLARDVGDADAVVGVDGVLLCEGEEVATAAAYIALEHEDIPCHLNSWFLAEVTLVEAVTLLGGEVVRCTETLCLDGVLAERVVGGVAHVDAPAPEGTHCAHVGNDGILAALARDFLVSAVLPRVPIFTYRLQGSAVLEFLFLEELVLIAEEVLDKE